MYINVENDDENIGHHGRFSLEIENEVGFYELVAFIVPNPTSRNSQNNFFPIEMAHRFTIEVIE